jgi:hypothetical protein
MNDGGIPAPRDSLAVLASELHRWNRQINLVSRVESDARVAALIEQCRAGWRLALGALGDQPWWRRARYIDLGTGGGLPGLVWAVERRIAGHDGPTVLVEPRDKRAWFLNRTVRLMGLERVTVLGARWGAELLPDAGPAPGPASDPGVLVSLKALRLDDGEILEGLGAAWPACPPGCPVAIVRFLDPEDHTREWLADRFALSGRGGHAGWRRHGVEILGSGDPRLLLTRYTSP